MKNEDKPRDVVVVGTDRMALRAIDHSIRPSDWNLLLVTADLDVVRIIELAAADVVFCDLRVSNDLFLTLARRKHSYPVIFINPVVNPAIPWTIGPEVNVGTVRQLRKLLSEREN